VHGELSADRDGDERVVVAGGVGRSRCRRAECAAGRGHPDRRGDRGRRDRASQRHAHDRIDGQPAKLACCVCGACIGACSTKPPPPLWPKLDEELLLGDAHGSLGDGELLLVAPGVGGAGGVGDDVSWPLRALVVAVGIGRPLGDDDELGDDDALDTAPHTALCTGSAGLDDDADGEGSTGRLVGLDEGNACGLGPLPPPANAVAAREPNNPTATAVTATDVRFISGLLRDWTASR
jgi:hypothetical protein